MKKRKLLNILEQICIWSATVFAVLAIWTPWAFAVPAMLTSITLFLFLVLSNL